MSDLGKLEEQLLGAVLDAETIGSNAGALIDAAGFRPEDFTSANVCTSWRVAGVLAGRRRPVTAATVYAAGASTRALGQDAQAWLQGLQAGNSLSRAEFAEVVDQVRRVSRSRQLERAIAEQLELLRGGGDIARVATALENACRDAAAVFGQDETGEVDVLELGAEAEAREAGQAPALLVPTGIPAIDAIAGGLPPNLCVIAGQPSVGKSALLGTALEQQLRLGLKPGLFGLEDGTRWLAKRLMARDLGVPVREIGVRHPSSFGEAWGRVGQEYATLLRGLTTYRHSTITADEMVRRAANWVTTRGVRCIWVDHGGEVEHRVPEGGDFRLGVKDTYRRLRDFATRYQVPVVVLAHTTRASNEREDAPPQLTDLAESAYIERMSRFVLGLWTRQKDGDKSLRVTVLKATEGERNVTLLMDRLTTAALVDPKSGEVVNLWAERMAELRAKKEARESQKAEKKPKRAQQMAMAVDA